MIPKGACLFYGGFSENINPRNLNVRRLIPLPRFAILVGIRSNNTKRGAA
jgi:hypothetical protein